MKAIIPFLAFAISLSAMAQETEVEPSGVVPAVVRQDVRLHAAPAGSASGALKSGTKLDAIGISPNGWVRVRTPQGKGWVARQFLQTPTKTQMPLKTFALKATHGTPGCFPDLAACPTNGCADAQSPHGLLNEAKRRTPAGTPSHLALADLAALQSAADNLVGQAAELDANDRQAIQSIPIGGRTIGEGQMVAITGFLVGNPHPNAGESVNCNLTDPASNDFHIPLSQRRADSPFDGVVVEMIPQSRNPAWTLDALKKVEAAGRPVMAVGQLFYDNVHRVNKDATHPLGGQPARFSLWEVHPIVDFFVCKAAAPCDANNSAHWTKLESVAFPLH